MIKQTPHMDEVMMEGKIRCNGGGGGGGNNGKGERSSENLDLFQFALTCDAKSLDVLINEYVVGRFIDTWRVEENRDRAKQILARLCNLEQGEGLANNNNKKNTEESVVVLMKRLVVAVSFVTSRSIKGLIEEGGISGEFRKVDRNAIKTFLGLCKTTRITEGVLLGTLGPAEYLTILGDFCGSVGGLGVYGR